MPAPPNILLITTDQQRADSLSVYGSAFTSTPRLDRLGRQGVRFDRAYCANPVCTPARASIFTGQYLSRHGAWNVGLNIPETAPMVSYSLAAAGYRRHYIGKAHFHSFGGPPEKSFESLKGWEKRFPAFQGPYYGFQTVELALGHATYGIAGHYGVWVRSRVSEEAFNSFKKSTGLVSFHFGGQAHDWDIPLELHNSVWTADRAIAFLEAHADRQPFFLAVGFQDPHHPHCLPRGFLARVNPSDVPLPDFVKGELDDKPPHFLEAHTGQIEQSRIRGRFPVAGMGASDFRRVTEADARMGRAYYYGLVRLIDQETGRILDALDHTGLAENTLVVFTTDHGELLGDHGLWMKGPFHYEPLVRVPLLLRWPQGFPGGQTLSTLISHVDLAPTILSAAGLDRPAALDGFDALPLLRGEASSLRDAALIECVDDPGGLRLKTLVTVDRKLTWYCGQDYGELYDLETDGREKVNRWDDPAYGKDRLRLLGRLLDALEPLERRVERDCYA